MSPVANMTECIGRSIEKFKIGFIQNSDDLARNTGNEVVDSVLRNECAGRIVWIGDKDDFRLGRNRLQHRLQIRLKVYRRHLKSLRAEELPDELVGDKCVLGSDHIIA